MTEENTELTSVPPMTMTFEVVVIPVADVDRAMNFYARLGWRLDLDFDSGDGYRVIQFTPLGSGCSVTFGSKVSTEVAGSAQGLHVVVPDIEAVRTDLQRRGITVSGMFHDPSGIFHRVGAEGRAPGPNPYRRSYASYFSFSDPDGNSWTVQEVTARLGPDLTAADPRFSPELVYAALHPAHLSATIS